MSLYRALHPEDTEVTAENITIVTLKQNIYRGIHNDLGFMVNNRLIVLVEAQSTWTYNVIPRMLSYLVHTYNAYISSNKLNKYGTETIPLPVPELYLMYSGDSDGIPSEISLAGDFFGLRFPDQISIDLRVKVLCTGLTENDVISQMIEFWHIYDSVITQKGRTRDAVHEIIQLCRKKNILIGFIEKEEVFDIMWAMMSDEEDLAIAREADIREAREETRKEYEEVLKQEREANERAREEERKDKLNRIFQNIRSIEKRFHIDRNQTMDILNIPQNERELYLAMD
ncbi:MAG: hypothetical protein IJ242_11575 [Clostridia bacterium]|nr:hypothetical protein [Clostridia bacterium]